MISVSVKHLLQTAISEIQKSICMRESFGGWVGVCVCCLAIMYQLFLIQHGISLIGKHLTIYLFLITPNFVLLIRVASLYLEYFLKCILLNYIHLISL